MHFHVFYKSLWQSMHSALSSPIRWKTAWWEILEYTVSLLHQTEMLHRIFQRKRATEWYWVFCIVEYVNLFCSLPPTSLGAIWNKSSAVLYIVTLKLLLPYLTPARHAGLRPCSHPTAGTYTALGPSRRWYNTSGSLWGLGTAPCLATHFSPRLPSQTDAPLLAPPAPRPQEAP